MGDDISLVVDQRSASVAGAAYCSDRQGLVVFLKPGSVEAEQALSQAGAKYPELTLEFQHVPRSVDEMRALVDEVLAVGLDNLGLVGIGPDVYTGGLQIYLPGYGENANQAHEKLISDAEAAVWAVIGADVPLVTTVETTEPVDAL
jgi:hypothetical protein